MHYNQSDNDKYIGSSQYFQDAIDWYCVRYLLCVTERAWLLIIALFLSSVLLLLTLDMFSYFPLKTDFSFVKYTDRYTDEFSVIKKLSTNTEDSEETLLSRYLVAQYVKRYESYSYNDLESQFNFIKNNSSRKIYLAFKEMMSSARYSDNSEYNLKTLSINTTIDNVKLVSMDFTSLNSAVVTFETQVAINGVISHVESHKVLVSFSLSSIKMAISGIMPLEFIVHDYKKLN
ncbi:MAG: VirB8/TrbF family protein [Ehrlichia sp.]